MWRIDLFLTSFLLMFMQMARLLKDDAVEEKGERARMVRKPYLRSL
jgi:hypothetical protein